MTYDERERRGHSGGKGEEKVDREEEKCGRSRVVSHANSSCKPRSPINDPLFCAGARQRDASLVIVVVVVIVASRRCFRRRCAFSFRLMAIKKKKKKKNTIEQRERKYNVDTNADSLARKFHDWNRSLLQSRVAGSFPVAFVF